MSPVAGVDGGGSGSRAVVLDHDGRRLGSGEGPPGRVEPGDLAGAAEAVAEAVRAAAEDAGLELPLEALWCGLAGAGRRDERRAMVATLEGRGLASRIAVGTDVEGAFRDAFGPAAAGVLLIAGTGSVALGRSTGGGSVRVGGWGELLGDEGSGYRIGLEGLRAVLRAHDGREPATALRGSLLEAVGVEAPEDLVGFAARASKADLGALAPEVIRTADAGDAAARRIVEGAVDDLAAHVEAALGRLEVADEQAEVVLTGGLLAPGRLLGGRLEARLRRNAVPAVRREVRGERGAARLALEALGGGGR